MIRVGIVDDHVIVRAALKQFLDEHEDLKVAGEAGNGRDAIELVRTTPLDVLILDLFMPDHSGLDALNMIRAKAPKLGILILSGCPEEQYAANLIRQGASGYLNKDCPIRQILDAVRTVARGRRYISSVVAEALSRALAPDTLRPSHARLSDREFQVFLRLAKGESSGEIAEALCLSLKTISTHRLRVLAKLALATNSELTYYALKHKLLD